MLAPPGVSARPSVSEKKISVQVITLIAVSRFIVMEANYNQKERDHLNNN